MVSDVKGIPLHFTLSGGHARDISMLGVLNGAHFPSSPDRLRQRCRWLIADKGFDAESLRNIVTAYRMQPVIPLYDMKRKPKLGLPRLLGRPKYRQRNAIEKLFD